MKQNKNKKTKMESETELPQEFQEINDLDIQIDLSPSVVAPKKEIFHKIGKIFENNSLQIMSFYFSLIKQNIFFWIISFIFLISQPLTMLILFLLNFDLVNNSFIFNIAPLFVGLIWLLFLITKLFLENKLNGIDVIMLSKPISKYETYFSRIGIVFGSLFLIMLFQFIVTSILVFSFGYEAQWVIYLLVNNLLITPFLSSAVASILILLAILFKPLWFGLASFLVVLLIGVAPITSRLVQKNDFDTTIVYDNNNYNSFSKLSIIDDNKNQTFLVDQINPESQLNVDKNVVGSLNNAPFYEYLIPGELMMSLSSSLLSDLNINDREIKGNYSLLKNSFIDVELANLNLQNSVLVSLRPDDISPFELNAIEYENLLLDNIKTIVNSNDFINLNDEKIVDFIYDKLTSSLNWQETFTNDELFTIRALLGIDIKFSQLFYYFNDHQLLSQKTPNILKEIELQINPALSKLMAYLWSDNSSQINVYDLKTFGDVYTIFPNAKSEILTNQPNINDVLFIKNHLVRFQGSAISYLDINKQYIPTNLATLQKIDPSIIDKASWDSFIDNSAITLQNLKNLSTLLNANLQNIFQTRFRPNANSLFKYSHFLEIKTTSYLDQVYLPIITIIFIVIGTNILAIYMFKNKNYKLALI